MDNLYKLRTQIMSRDGEIRLEAVDKLAAIGGNKALSILIPLLSSDDAAIRNSAALSLRKIADNRAVKPLVKAINNSKNRQNSGTLVYALETLDCSKLLLTLVTWALYGDFEVQNHALTIISEQSFKTSSVEIKNIKNLIKKYKKSKNKCEDSELLIGDLEEYLSSIEKEIKKQDKKQAK